MGELPSKLIYSNMFPLIQSYVAKFHDQNYNVVAGVQ